MPAKKQPIDTNILVSRVRTMSKLGNREDILQVMQDAVDRKATISWAENVAFAACRRANGRVLGRIELTLTDKLESRIQSLDKKDSARSTAIDRDITRLLTCVAQQAGAKGQGDLYVGRVLMWFGVEFSRTIPPRNRTSVPRGSLLPGSQNNLIYLSVEEVLDEELRALYAIFRLAQLLDLYEFYK